jgi:hypothetical protein
MKSSHPLTKYARTMMALGPNLFLVLAAWFLPPDEENRGPMILSIAGNFHILALHLPAALLLIVPMFDLWDRHAEANLATRRLALIAAVGTWIAVLFGIFHAHFNGFENSADVSNHLWAGVAASFLASASWVVIFEASLKVRVALQIITILVMSLAAHIGGEMVHGKNFPFKPNKESTKQTTTQTAVPSGFLIPSAYGAETVQSAAVNLNDYEQVIAPILKDHCEKCHGEKKVKGKLRLDSLPAILKGGHDGPGVVWGDLSKSHVIQRVILDPKDDEAMPPKDETPLSEAQLQALKLWVNQQPIPAALAEACRPRATTTAPAPTFQKNAVSAVAVEKVADQLGIAITPLSTLEAKGWRVAAHTLGVKFGTEQLKQLTPILPEVAELDLALTHLDDQASEILALGQRVQFLMLADTQVGDRTAQMAVEKMPFLQRASFVNTNLTDQGLLALAQAPQLQALYVAGTKVTTEGLKSFRQRQPRCRLVYTITLEPKEPSPGIEPPKLEKNAMPPAKK